MEYRRLGSAGMKVSVISFGGWLNFGEGVMAEELAGQLITTAYDQGINFFDIADIYRKGEAETQMGKILKQFPRQNLVISSKVFWPMSDNVNDRGLSRKHIMESIDASLKRIGTDYLDIYFCHRHDPETTALEVARAMTDLIQQGKILYWGTSEWTGQEVQEVCDVCEKYHLYKPQTDQPQYSLVHRKRVEQTLLPVTKKEGMGLVVWSPLGQGFLTGKYDGGIPENTRLGREKWAQERFFQGDLAERSRKLQPIADEMSITRGQLALAWILHEQGVSSAITGATQKEQLLENVKAANITLSEQTLAQLNDLFNPALESE